MKKKIAIIGSGIAGLTLAVLLRGNPNCEFTVYEKGDFLDLNEGFGVQLSVNSVSILNKIGFNELDKNEKYHPSKLDFYSIDCNKICDLDLPTFNSENEKYTTLKRSILIKFLKEKLLSNSIIFRKKINKDKKINEKIEINFTEGSNDKVDYLIVSDGVFSKSKSIILNKDIKPKYFKSIAVRGNLKDYPNEDISIYFGSNFHFVIYPVNKKNEFNFILILKKKLLDKKIYTDKNFLQSITKELYKKT